MTDAITNDLVTHPGITRADSWPTGMRNAGPEEYGIDYNPNNTTRNSILDTLETQIETTMSSDVHLLANAGEDYDLIVSVIPPDSGLDTILEAHGLTPSRVVDETGQKTADVYTADWLPTDIFVTQDGTAHATDAHNTTKYTPDDVTDFIEMVTTHYADHTSPSPSREQDTVTRTVTEALVNHTGIEQADGWLCSGDEPGDNAYGITYDPNAIDREDVLSLVETLIAEHDEDADTFPATIRDSTDHYTNEAYTLVASVTFQLS